MADLSREIAEAIEAKAKRIEFTGEMEGEFPAGLVICPYPEDMEQIIRANLEERDKAVRDLVTAGRNCNNELARLALKAGESIPPCVNHFSAALNSFEVSE